MTVNWDDELVAAATAALEPVADGDFRTVGAAVRDVSGAIYTGVNLFHFTGGPCAEMVALANAGGARLVRVVAVGDENRGVLAPCGRCRQVLMDLAPGIRVMLPDGAVRPVEELLPQAYRWSEGL